MFKFLKNLFIYVLLIVSMLALFWFNLDNLHMSKLKNQILDTYIPDSRYVQLQKDFLNDKNWNVEENTNIKELNFARYSAFKHKLTIYMQSQLPKKQLQLETLKKIDSDGVIVDGNNKVLANTNQLFPLHFNSTINNLAKEYANSGAVDTPNLVHSPSNPQFSGSEASQNHPDFSRWYINDYVQVRKESISTGYNKIADTIKAWIGEDDNIEQDSQNVLGHRLHVLDVEKDVKYAAIEKSPKSGWVMHSGVVLDSNWNLVNTCDFINIDKENFTYRQQDKLQISTYFPAQNNTLKFNPNVCYGIEIKAYYPDDLNNSLLPGQKLDPRESFLVFKQEAKKGFIIKNSKDLEALQVQIIK